MRGAACWDAGVVPVPRDLPAGSSPRLRLVATTAGPPTKAADPTATGGKSGRAVLRKERLHTACEWEYVRCFGHPPMAASQRLEH